MDSLSNLIRNLREAKGLSQRQLASLSGVSNTEISRIENGRRKQPSQEILLKLAKALTIPYEELLIAAGYHTIVPESLHSPINSHVQLQKEKPELYHLWQSIRQREDLKTLLKEASVFQPATVKQLIQLLKMVKDK